MKKKMTKEGFWDKLREPPPACKLCIHDNTPLEGPSVCFNCLTYDIISVPVVKRRFTKFEWNGAYE